MSFRDSQRCIFSIVIPTYNASSTIVRALDSIRNRVGQHLVETLVIDDGSSDETMPLVERYAAEYGGISLLKTDRNGGPGTARNLGVEHATGEWICFLDADDELEPGFFDGISQAFGGNIDYQIDLIAFDVNIRTVSTANGSDVKSRDDLWRLGSAADKWAILSDFLKNRIDPSVIFHAFRRDFLLGHNIQFRTGLHEDIDYMFNVHLRSANPVVIEHKLYRKWDTEGSIINTLSHRHIEGYFEALTAIMELLLREKCFNDLWPDFRVGVINVAASRLMRLLQPKIVKQNDIRGLLKAIFVSAKALLVLDDGLNIPKKLFRTKYEIIFAEFIAAMEADVPVGELLARLELLREKSWSCYDLQNSVFLAPGEIRTCCKRFFVDRELKGDVVLMRNTSDEEFIFNYDDIKREKKKLHFDINRDDAPQCSGCPFLSFDDWGQPLSNGVKYISLEYHSICNMRCVYCSDTYFGGKKAMYDVSVVIDSVASAGALAGCEYAVWGGGEPTVDKWFPEIATKLAEAVPRVRQRVITNATLFSETLSDLIKRDKAFIVTSLDAGTEKTFQTVHQYKHFGDVLCNLRRYAETASENVIIKYILIQENSATEELRAFVNLIEQNGLLGCNFQISCDFKNESITTEQSKTLARLYAMLCSRGAHFVFFDDLVWQRLPKMDEFRFNTVRDALALFDVADALVQPSRFPAVAVWGTGAQARLLMEKSWFLRNSNVAYFVDPRQYIDSVTFYDRPVVGPGQLQRDGLPIVIAAVQSAPFIYRDAIAMGIHQDMIVTGLVL